MKLAHTVFFVTDNKRADNSPEKEFQMGKTGVDAALEVRHPTSPPNLFLPLPPCPQEGAWVGSNGVRLRRKDCAALPTACAAVVACWHDCRLTA